MPGRSFGAEEYRFGFNGQERDDEVSGVGNINTALFWEYDTRIGKRWNIDPIIQENISGYAVLLNSPITIVDLLGNVAEPVRKPLTEIILSDNEVKRTSSLQTTPSYDFYKTSLISFVKEKKLCVTCSENDLGLIFEDLVYELTKTRLQFQNQDFKKNDKKFGEGNRNTIPDFVGNSHIFDFSEFNKYNQQRIGERPLFNTKYPIFTRINDAAWIEAKQKNGNIYMSTSTYQIKGHIDNMSSKFADVQSNLKSYGIDWRPTLYIVTTADVKISQTIFEYATKQKIHLKHYSVVFKYNLDNKNYEFNIKSRNEN
jgi:hypothetical protein